MRAGHRAPCAAAAAADINQFESNYADDVGCSSSTRRRRRRPGSWRQRRRAAGAPVGPRLPGRLSTARTPYITLLPTVTRSFVHRLQFTRLRRAKPQQSKHTTMACVMPRYSTAILYVFDDNLYAPLIVSDKRKCVQMQLEQKVFRSSRRIAVN